ncbi:MAG: GNAT family N-acetyltransferase [Bacteroidia bacterium]
MVPKIKTERLLLRKIALEDAAQLLHIRSDKTINRYIVRQVPLDVEEVQEFVKKLLKGMGEGTFMFWAICWKDKPAEVLGTICFWNFSQDRTKAETGYELLPVYHGNGIMSEALEALLQVGLHDLGLEQIEAFTHVENIASIALLERAGFQLEPERRDPKFPHNRVYVKNVFKTGCTTSVSASP